MLEQAADAIVMIDSENRIAFFNGAAERMWGWKKDAVIGRDVGMLIPRADGGADGLPPDGHGEFLIMRSDGVTVLGVLHFSRIGDLPVSL